MMRGARGLVLGLAAVCRHGSRKIERFARGQKHIVRTIERECQGLDPKLPTVWFHCSSLGEFGIARPLISQLKGEMPCNVVLTFFSPTGYDALTARGRTPDGPDRVFFLPLDTRSNARRFLDAVNPKCAVFLVSEYWHNFLNELSRRKIPTLLVSAIIRRDSPFFRWYGGIYRSSLRCFSHIFALNNASRGRLKSLGVSNVTVNGDPLFDNARLIADTEWHSSFVERFTASRRTFIAGSIHPGEDLEMTAALANRHRDVPFIIVPHEISEGTLRMLESRLEWGSRRLSQCDETTDFSGVQTLIVDSVGSLAYLYRYGTWAYVGGGFSRLLHSVIEPVVYGLPVAFGPQIFRKVTPLEMIELGIGEKVVDIDGLDDWFSHLKDDERLLADIQSRARTYIKRNAGATPRVVDAIISAVCRRK